ncbi:MAG: DEAD/DEAH box helicase, partial [Acidimicrobiales bacterium]
MPSPTFADLGVPAALCAVLAERGVLHPFPIQAATLPDALAGHDICGRAPTGSGKTLAFGIPLVVALDRSARWSEPARPRALVLVPTRELAA